MAEKQKITKAGYQKIQSQLDELINVTIEEVKKQLKEAREQGDLSENADYDAARNKQAEVEAKISELQEILANSEVIDEHKTGKKGNRVGLGSTVRVLRSIDNQEFTYSIVSAVESNPLAGAISNACPLGEALMGKTVGDVVEVKGKKTYQVTILDLKND